MKEKTCLIRQPAGIGDIFLCQKIANTIIQKGYKVVWPVIPKYLYIGDYICDKNIQFVDETGDFIRKDMYLTERIDPYKEDNFIYVPLMHADRKVSHPSMLVAKYIYFGVDWQDWKSHFNFDRNYEREAKLRDYLKIDGKFNLINRLYGTPPNSLQNPNIHVDNGYRNIIIEPLEFDNVFDWCGLFEDAEEIHMVDTSFSLIMAKLGIKNVNLYERHPGEATYGESDSDYIHRDFFSDDWNYFTHYNTC